MTIGRFKASDHADTQFAPHGEIEIWPEGPVVKLTIHGPFNSEGILAFGQTLGALLGAWKPTGPFASLATWHGSMMASPDALALYGKMLKAGRQAFPHEIVSVWHVPNDIEGRVIMQARWQALYDAADYPLRIVHDAAAAHALIREHLSDALPA